MSAESTVSAKTNWGTVLNFALPYFFLILIAAELYIGFSPASSVNFLITAIVWIFLFDALHIFFSFINMWMIPQFQEVMKAQKESVLKHAMIITVLAILLAPIYLNSQIFGPQTYVIAVFFVIILPGYHIFRQVLGLSLQFNMQHFAKLSPQEKIFFQKREMNSRRLEKMAMILFIVGAIPRSYEFIKKSLNWEIASTEAINFFATALFSAALVLLFLSFAMLGDRKLIIKKFLFSARHLVYALSHFSAIGKVGVRAIHGTEYALFQQQIIKNSLFGKKLKHYFVLTVAVMLGYSVVLLLPALLNPLGNHKTLSGLILLHFVLTYYHYYLDSKFYKFKDSKTREVMAPLLNGVLEFRENAQPPSDQIALMSTNAQAPDIRRVGL